MKPLTRDHFPRSRQFERELIRTRTGEGRERAKARGVILGRKPKLTSHQKREAIARREAGEVLTDIARSYNVSHSTITRRSKMSHVLRRSQASPGFDVKPIETNDLESYWSLDRLPNPVEAVNNLVLNAGKRLRFRRSRAHLTGDASVGATMNVTDGIVSLNSR